MITLSPRATYDSFSVGVFDRVSSRATSFRSAVVKILEGPAHFQKRRFWSGGSFVRNQNTFNDEGLKWVSVRNLHTFNKEKTEVAMESKKDSAATQYPTLWPVHRSTRRKPSPWRRTSPLPMEANSIPFQVLNFNNLAQQDPPWSLAFSKKKFAVKFGASKAEFLDSFNERDTPVTASSLVLGDASGRLYSITDVGHVFSEMIGVGVQSAGSQQTSIPAARNQTLDPQPPSLQTTVVGVTGWLNG